MQNNIDVPNLKSHEVIFSEASFVDDFGRVFFLEGRVFRAIFNNKKEYCLSLLNSDLFKELNSIGLIPKTWIADIALEGYSLVLEHELINESAPHHWSFTMYRDASLLILKVRSVCNKYGFELKDAHPYNVFFKENNPVFIDLGSIIKKSTNDGWSAYEEFINYCYIQLLLWNKSEFFLTRKLIEDGNNPFSRSIPMSRILDSRFLDIVEDDIFDHKLFFRDRLLFQSSSRNKLIDFLNNAVNRLSLLIIKRKISSLNYTVELKDLSYVEERIINLKRPFDKSDWENYHNVYKAGELISSTPRFDRIIELVGHFAPDIKTSVDLAGNQGVFCYLLSRKLKLNRIFLTDYDEKAIDKAYHTFKLNRLDIQPYLFNFMRPLKSEEIHLLKSDIVFALAITHHLILSQNYLLSAVIKRICKYSYKYVVIEFMPLGLYGGGDSFPKIPEWYTLEWFRNELKQHVNILAEEKLEINRIVFIGTKISSNS